MSKEMAEFTGKCKQEMAEGKEKLRKKSIQASEEHKQKAAETIAEQKMQMTEEMVALRSELEKRSLDMAKAIAESPNKEEMNREMEEFGKEQSILVPRKLESWNWNLKFQLAISIGILGNSLIISQLDLLLIYHF